MVVFIPLLLMAKLLMEIGTGFMMVIFKPVPDGMLERSGKDMFPRPKDHL